MNPMPFELKVDKMVSDKVISPRSYNTVLTSVLCVEGDYRELSLEFYNTVSFELEIKNASESAVLKGSSKAQ